MDAKQVITRYQCCDCGATFPPSTSLQSLRNHEGRWHDGVLQTIWPVMAEVIEGITERP